MLLLTIRTDNPQAELGLFNNNDKLAYISWAAHRELAETIHLKIKDLLANNHRQLSELQGIVVFQGPGSFTGLRIGISVANALADSLQIPIIGAQGQSWAEQGSKELLDGQNDQIVLPAYGADPHITTPRK